MNVNSVLQGLSREITRVLVVAACGLLLPAAVFGARGGGGPAIPPPPGTSNDSFYNNIPGGGFNSFDSPHFDYIPPRPMVVYFPPEVPRLDAHVEMENPREIRRPAPVELASFVNEPFYSPLSTRLAEKTLSSRQRNRLDAYLAEKIHLQNELRARLAHIKNLDSGARQRDLEEFAREQTPKIVALEATAEELRVDLIHGELFQSNVDWNHARQWHLGDQFFTPSDAISAQALAMRGAAFYQKGFSPAQRRMIREIAMELGEVSPLPGTTRDTTEPGETPTDSNPLLFFSPETSRLRPPLNLPEDLAQKISDYEREKSELKKELRDEIIARDNSFVPFVRTLALEGLARRQAPRLAALEDRAEEIRRAFAQLPNQPHLPPAPAIPPAMAERLTEFMQRRREIQKNLVQLLNDTARTVNVARIDYVKDADGKLTLNLTLNSSDRAEGKMQIVRDKFAAYSKENAANTAELQPRLTALRVDAAQVLGLGAGPEAVKQIDRFLSDCAGAIEEQMDWQLYTDYRTAVIEPGLSPEQRRLLFDASLVDLDLPLPARFRIPRDIQNPGLVGMGPRRIARDMP